MTTISLHTDYSMLSLSYLVLMLTIGSSACLSSSKWSQGQHGIEPVPQEDASRDSGPLRFVTREATPRNNSSINKVHIVYMNHLDVGYSVLSETGYINNVLNMYFTTFFPQAVQLAEQLENGGYQERLVYTTHPWLVEMYMDCPPNLVLAGVKLKCPNSTEIAAFTKAVQRGHITWHAGAMNLQIENYDASLFEFSLSISSKLDVGFGITRKRRVMSQRDVPGFTHAAIPSLVKMGVSAVTVGVNNMTPPPAVPRLFRWRHGSQEVMATWHPGGYPDNPGPSPAYPGGLSRRDCVVMDNFTDALCFIFRTDNSGPPHSISEVLNDYAILRVEFPGADLHASTLDQYFEVVDQSGLNLPVVDKEIGDVWIQGIASDPKKLAEYRAVSRAMSTCIHTGNCSYSDRRVYNSSRFLTKLGEHTWGLNGVNDYTHWSNQQLAEVINTPSFKNATASWAEQRNITGVTLEALEDHPVRSAVEEELSQLKPKMPDLQGFKQLSPSEFEKTFSCYGNVSISFASDGSLSSLKYGSASWATPDSTLAKFIYQTYNASDFDWFGQQFDYKSGISAGYTKINITQNAHPVHRRWPVTMTALFQNNAIACDFWAHLQMVDEISWSKYGAPRDVWVRYTSHVAPSPGVAVTFQWFGKTRTRLPESLFLAFSPVQQPGHRWMMTKLGHQVDPLNVSLNGSQHQHAVGDEGVQYVTPDNHGIKIESLDVAVACPITDSETTPTAFPAPLQPISKQITGMAYNFYNNVWDTNYIFWYPYLDGDEDFKARFDIVLV